MGVGEMGVGETGVGEMGIPHGGGGGHYSTDGRTDRQIDR